ncbi:unnamed protein product [Blepharisma stoltei]|uniref:Uncharacterized protein n=1 Tax=Blepharisma stoltei TaxID=1481888 RepID=A0AAU9J4C9_9CILI|nr:unnamed protein product [Blepharisma stoltei]
MTLDPDNIPSTITLICSGATIDSSLFAKMWSDLQSYVQNKSSMIVSLFQSLLGSAGICLLYEQPNRFNEH